MHSVLSNDITPPWPQRTADGRARIVGQSDTTLGERLFVGRQPILDRGGQVVAYTLLHRRAATSEVRIWDASQATSQVILAAFLEFGLSKLTASRPAFVNIPQELLTAQGLQTLPRADMVLEIARNAHHTHGAYQQQLDALRRQGFSIALHERDLGPESAALIGLADIIRVDVNTISEAQLAQRMAQLRAYPATLLAEKVETQRQFDRCLELGFDLFQGYYFLRPQVQERRRLPSCRHGAMQTLAAVHRPNVTLASLGNLVERDVTLCYRVLKYINSPLCGFNGTISSIQHAVLLIGMRRLQQLASLIALTGIDDKPNALMATALVRAKMCEELATRLRCADRDQAFCVGMLSTLDAFFDRPLEEMVNELALAPELATALNRRDGPAGRILDNAIAYENGQWGPLEKSGIDAEVLQEAYLHAIQWADRTLALYDVESRSEPA